MVKKTQQQFVAVKIHINVLDFIVVILQLAAAIGKYEETPTNTIIQPL